MTATGDHGGDSVAEVDAALFAYTPRGFLRAPLPTVATTGEIAPLPFVEQVDLVPTLAALTGTSIPFSNLGIVITQLLNFDLVGPVNENFKQVSSVSCHNGDIKHHCMGQHFIISSCIAIVHCLRNELLKLTL